MITRIKYAKNGNKIISEVFVINSELALRVEINSTTSELILKCEDTGKSYYDRKCPSIVAAKYHARKKLIELGMRFNREYRK